MPDEIRIRPHGNLLKLLEYYALACIDELPAAREAALRQGVERTYRSGQDWKLTLQGVLKLNPTGQEVLRQRWQAAQERASQSGATLDPEAFVRGLLEEIFPEQTIPKPVELPKYRQTAPVVLKTIGYWQENHGVLRLCPQPQSLVCPDWHLAERELILGYLRGGFAYEAFGGWSTCRFRCAAGEHNGSLELTDGEWSWPEGLAHYVEFHNLTLPEEFVETMRTNQWRVPDVADVAPWTWKSDLRFWLEWVATHGRKAFRPRER
jgi:hypothetical protein